LVSGRGKVPRSKGKKKKLRVFKKNRPCSINFKRELLCFKEEKGGRDEREGEETFQNDAAARISTGELCFQELNRQLAALVSDVKKKTVDRGKKERGFGGKSRDHGEIRGKRRIYQKRGTPNVRSTITAWGKKGGVLDYLLA